MKIIKNTDSLKSIDTSMYKDRDRFIIFDIDGTLYKENHEIITARRMAGYKHLETDIKMSFEEYDKLSTMYTHMYGLHYKGFLKDFPISDNLYKGMDNVNEDMTSLLSSNDKLIDFLREITGKGYQRQNNIPIFCFTNTNSKQSEHVLDVLKLTPYIDTLFCVGYKKNKEVICKPSVEAFEFVNQVIKKSDLTKILFFDDNIKNIESAKKVGWIGVLVNDADNIINIVKKEIKKHF